MTSHVMNNSRDGRTASILQSCVFIFFQAVTECFLEAMLFFVHLLVEGYVEIYSVCVCQEGSQK